MNNNMESADLNMESADLDMESANLRAAKIAHRVDTDHSSLEARLLRRLLRQLGNPPIEFNLRWSGERVAPAGVSPVEHVRIADRRTLFGLLLDPQIRFGDAYCSRPNRCRRGSGRISQPRCSRYSALWISGTSIVSRLAGHLHRPRRNTLAGSRENIHRHYDLGNDFYALWLGETMAYTCAYYPTAQATLEQAQVAKMDHVCRKLRLSAADSVVEAGCGWGSLALHIAEPLWRQSAGFQHLQGADRVRAPARPRAGPGGSGRVHRGRLPQHQRDPTTCSSRSACSNTSAGENYPELGRVVQRSLTADGRGLIHSIGRNRPEPLHPWIERRIFPGAYPPSLGEMMQIFEPSSLSVLDVENIRLHYALTLRHWLERYEAAMESVRAMFDETFVRMWRLYLAGSIAAFETGDAAAVSGAVHQAGK